MFGLDTSAGPNQKRVCMQQPVTTAVVLEDMTVVAGLVPTQLSGLGGNTAGSGQQDWRALDPIVSGVPLDDTGTDWSLVLGDGGAFGAWVSLCAPAGTFMQLQCPICMPGVLTSE